MSTGYFYAVDGRRQGPISAEELKRLALSGEIKRLHKIWCKGMNAWQTADSVPGLFEDLPPDLEPESDSSIPAPSETVRQTSKAPSTRVPTRVNLRSAVHTAGFKWACLAILLGAIIYAVVAGTGGSSHGPDSFSFDHSSSAPAQVDVIGSTPGFPISYSDKVRLREAARTYGVSEAEMEKMRVRGTHWAEYPEDMPGGANDRERAREQSRKDSGWYEQH